MRPSYGPSLGLSRKRSRYKTKPHKRWRSKTKTLSGGSPNIPRYAPSARMLNSAVATRRLLSTLSSRSRIAAARTTALRRLSSDVPPLPPPRPIPSEEQTRPQKEAPEGLSPVEAARIAKDDGEARRNGNRSRPNEGVAGKYGDTQARVFIAALSHTARLGWTESALIAGARDVGVSPVFIGLIPHQDAALVEF